MHAAYDEVSWRGGENDELASEDTRDIPFFGFVTGTVISLGLWGVVAWAVWAVVR